MCLVAIAWRAHPRYPLVVAGNRDEQHARPAAPAGWWSDAPGVIGGRDLVAGGSWLTISRAGRFAVVTNYPGRAAAAGAGASRGLLVRDFVTGGRPGGRYLDAVQVNEARYAGFCLIVGTRAQLRALASPAGAGPRRWTLRRGVTVVSNSPADRPWPKARYLETAVSEALSTAAPGAEDLFALLARREPVDAEDGNMIGRTPFVLDPIFGTRASTVVMIDAEGACTFVERRFGPDGQPAGETRETFHLD